MIEGVGVDHDSLRVSLPQHILEVGKKKASIQSKAVRIANGERLIRLGNANHLDIGTVLTFAEKPMDVPVDQAHDTHAKRSSRLGLDRLNGCVCIREREDPPRNKD
jgi:hypothetical protein